MPLRPLRADELKIGDALPYDIYDSTGRLLLRRGNRIESALQLERLQQIGLHGDGPAEAADQPHDDDDLLIHFPLARARRSRERVSVLGLVTEAGQRLEQTLAGTAGAPQFAAEIRSIAQGIGKCCALDSDAALAHILVANELRYPVRQMVNVAILTTLLLGRLHHDPERSIAAVAAALTMNLAMIDLQQELYAQNAPLGDPQRRIVHEHPLAGVAALRARGVADPLWLDVVATHHEALDGSGYPAGLGGEQVGREARVVGLADRYCSIVTERAYRPSIPPNLALKEIHTRHGGAVDPALLGLLITTMGLHPPGTCVALANGEIAVVTRRLLDAKHPVVFALYLNPNAVYAAPRKRLTASQPQYEIQRVVARAQVAAPLDYEQLWPRLASSATLGAAV